MHQNAKNPPLTTQAITATVLASRDPEIQVGTKVVVTGFVAAVPSVRRPMLHGGSKEHKDVDVSFQLGELQLHEPTGQLAAAAPAGGQGCGGVGNLPPDTLLLPQVWEKLLGYHILDWDGWNDVKYPEGNACAGAGRYLGAPCTRDEFERRAVECTMNVAAYVSRNPPQDVEVERLTKKIGDLKGAVIEALGGLRGEMSWADAMDLCKKYGEARGALSLFSAKPEADPEAKSGRNRMPDTRKSTTHKFDIAGQKGYITVGEYPSGQPGEVFIVVQKQGGLLQGVMDAWARSLSLLLQYGVPVREVARMFAWHKFEPMGVTTNPDIPMANSVVDYVARWLSARYAPGAAGENQPDGL